MKPDKFFVVGFYSFFWAWPCTKHNSCLLIFHLLKSNLKCFSIHESHCIERQSSHASFKQRSFVVGSFFASTCTFHGPCPAFLGFNRPSMIRSFPLVQESSELRFRFCLHNFGAKCLSEVIFPHWIYKLISLPVINSRFRQAFVFFAHKILSSLFVITLVQSKQI